MRTFPKLGIDEFVGVRGQSAIPASTVRASTRLLTVVLLVQSLL